MSSFLKESQRFRIIKTIKDVSCPSCPLREDPSYKNSLPCSLRVTLDTNTSFIRVLCGYCDFKSKMYYKDLLSINGILEKYKKVKSVQV